MQRHEELIEALLNDELDDELGDELGDDQVAELEAWLLADESHLRLFALRKHEHRLLRDTLRGQAEQHETSALPSEAEPADSGHRITSYLHAVARAANRPTPFSLTVAALVMLLMITAMAFMVPPFYRAMTRETPTIESELRIVAKLTGLQDAIWTEHQTASHQGAFLQSGHRMELAAGLAEVTYDNGAQIIIEAPAIVTISGPRQCDVALGKIVSRVPESAHGFTVGTKYGRIVDLGTQFAVEVPASGEAEVHVIEGRVEIHAATDDADQPPRQLTAGQAVRVQPSQGSPRLVEIKYDQQRFAKPLSYEDQWNEESPLPVTHDLSLWLAADFGVVRDIDGRVVFWKDRLTGDNRRAENASQGTAARRPLWVADGIGGQPAIRFDGRTNNLSTATRAIMDEQTIIAVFTPDPDGNGDRGGQIFNTGSVPNFVMDIVGNEVVVRSWNGTQNDPQLRVDRLTPGAPVIAAFTHSGKAQQSRLIVNGDSQVSSAAPQPISARGKSFIGCHIYFNSFYHGDLAELIVFDAALSKAELEAVQQYLRQKYQL